MRLADVLLPDQACRASANLAEYLVKSGFCLTSMPHHVTEMVQQRCPGAVQITPAIVRARFQADKRLKTLLSERPAMRASQASTLGLSRSYPDRPALFSQPMWPCLPLNYSH